MADIQAAENDLQRARSALLKEAKKAVLEAESGLKKTVRSVDTIKARHTKAADKATQAFKKKKELGSTEARRAKHAELVAKAKGIKIDLEAARTAKKRAQDEFTLAKSTLRAIEKREKYIPDLDELLKAPSSTRKRRKVKVGPATSKSAPKRKPSAKKAPSRKPGKKSITTTGSKRKSPGIRKASTRGRTVTASVSSTQTNSSS